MNESYSVLIKRAEGVVWNPPPMHRKLPSLYVAIYQESNPSGKKESHVKKTKAVKRSLTPSWEESVTLSVTSTDVITFRLYHNSTLGPDICLGEFAATIDRLSQLRGLNGVAKLDLKSKGKSTGVLSVDLNTVSAASVIHNAAAGAQKIFGGQLRALTDAVSNLAPDAGGLISPLGVIIDKLDVIVKIGNEIAAVHPYAQVAWNILTLVYKVVEKQQDTDDRLLKLVQTMVEVYSFVEDVEFLSQKIKRLEDSVLGITRETVECAIFIHEYTGKGFADRVARDTWSDTSETVDRLSEVLLQLKESFDRGIAIQSTFISVKLLETVQSIQQAQILKDLNPAEIDASTREICLPGTRTDILSEIRNWLSVPSDTGNILWLHGVFGAGKSAISLSISEYFRSLNRLGAFIFFTRTNLAGSTPNLLAKTNDNIRSAICDAITAETTLVTAPIHTQFQKLVVEPLLAAKKDIRGPIIIILDALDECGTRHSRRGLVSLIASEFPKLPAAFRIFITSRPDSDIAEQFRAQPLITAMQLDITTTATKNDILAYITETMRNIRRIKPGLGPEWPGESTIQVLANYSGGLFIWASTASKFLSESFDPQKALTILLNSGRNLAGKIDELDYITDPKRSGDHPWFINPDTQSRWLALGCLQVLNRELRFNICDLQDSHVLNVHVEDLQARMQTRISAQLAYASDFWAIHLLHSDHNQETLSELEKLMKKNFLYWLEILSLRMCVSAASQALEVALQYVQKEHASLQAFIVDAHKFIAAFAPVISQSAPHIYLSAIPSAPVQSLIRRQFSMFYPRALHFDGPSGENWPNIQKWSVGNSSELGPEDFLNPSRAIGEVATIQVWSNETGLAVGSFELTAQDAEFGAFAFSPDGKQVVLGSPNSRVEVWNWETSSLCAGPLQSIRQQRKYVIPRLFFTADGTNMACELDGSIRGWKASRLMVYSY
ncbi:hypothetical protein C8R44DRAFT_846399 [Mycena epipterygia]|nr:hypothetical protein C8R44DRAFT_846399 [Mycena epipterygia]